MDHYGEGLKHGYEDAYKAIRDTLALPVSDEEKLRLVAQQVESTAWGSSRAGAVK